MSFFIFAGAWFGTFASIALWTGRQWVALQDARSDLTGEPNDLDVTRYLRLNLSFLGIGMLRFHEIERLRHPEADPDLEYRRQLVLLGRGAAAAALFGGPLALVAAWSIFTSVGDMLGGNLPRYPLFAILGIPLFAYFGLSLVRDVRRARSAKERGLREPPTVPPERPLDSN